MPIIELDMILYCHLDNGSVIFNNKEWNLTLLEKELHPKPIVKCSMIREDYWMEWVDNVIGSRINWNNYDNGNGLTLGLVNGLADGLSVGEMLEFSYELTAQGVELEETLGLAVDLQMNFQCERYSQMGSQWKWKR